jgi:hypothetical protein
LKRIITDRGITHEIVSLPARGRGLKQGTCS